jgi:hypothetical protein
MFWRRRKSKNWLDQANSIFKMAARLSVDARREVRVTYPAFASVCRLPQALFNEQRLTLKNISGGGCCILDPDGFLGDGLPTEFELTLEWTTGQEDVRARMVSRVDQRRHIEFLDLSPQRKNSLKKSMVMGIRGLEMHSSVAAQEHGPRIQASEIWTSLQGDTLTFDKASTVLVQVQDVEYQIVEDQWPLLRAKGVKCSRLEVEQLILFVCNIPAPSDRLRRLQIDLERLLIKEAAA